MRYIRRREPGQASGSQTTRRTRGSRITLTPNTKPRRQAREPDTELPGGKEGGDTRKRSPKPWRKERCTPDNGPRQGGVPATAPADAFGQTPNLGMDIRKARHAHGRCTTARRTSAAAGGTRAKGTARARMIPTSVPPLIRDGAAHNLKSRKHDWFSLFLRDGGSNARFQSQKSNLAPTYLFGVGPRMQKKQSQKSHLAPTYLSGVGPRTTKAETEIPSGPLFCFFSCFRGGAAHARI